MQQTKVRPNKGQDMKPNKRLTIAGIGAGLLLMTAQTYAADAPRHLTIEDGAESATQESNSPQPSTNTVSVPAAPAALQNSELSDPITSEAPASAPNTSAVSNASETTQESPANSTEAINAETTNNADNVDGVLAADPSEGINRKIFAVNEAVDKVVVKPVAKGYKKIVPTGIRRCVSNMFDNLGTPYTAVNNVLQGKVKSAGQDIGRVLVNSVLGLGGCFDVATKFGIPKHEEDFGQTLAVWGVGSGRFVMLPGFGPSTVRDALAKPVDILANPIGYITNIRLRNSLTGYKFVDTRTNLLEVTDTLDESALDKYSMVRDAWLQRRAAQIRDEDGSYDSISTDAPRELKPSLAQ